MELVGSLEIVGYKNQGLIIYGLSEDTERLPLDVSAGSEFLAVDTGKEYIFSGESWFESGGV